MIWLIFLGVCQSIGYKPSIDLLNLTISGINEEITQNDYQKSGNYPNYLHITIIPGISSIADYAFSGSTVVKTISIPNTVLSIGEYAFQNCNELQDVQLPENLKKISNNLFMYCKKLPNLTIPASVEIVGTWHTFMQCNELKYFNVSSGNKNYYTASDGKLLVHINGTASAVVGKFSSIEIPKGILALGEFFANGRTQMTKITFEKGSKCDQLMLYAFRATSITSITIPEGVTILGTAIFELSPIQNIIFPSTLKSVSDGVLSGAGSIQTVTVPKNCTGLIIDDKNVIYNSTKNRIIFLPIDVEEFEIPGTVRYINTVPIRTSSAMRSLTVNKNNNYFFAEGNVLYENSTTHLTLIACMGNQRNVVIHKDCKYIGSYSFQYTNVTNIEVKGKVIEVKSLAFSDTPMLQSIDLSNCVNIRGYSFLGSNISSIKLGSSLRILEYESFRRSNFESIDLSETKLEFIQLKTFDSCKNLKTVILPNSIKNISDYAFYDCKLLNSISIPNTVQVISSKAFFSTGLTSIIFLETSTCIDIQTQAFYGCKFTSVTIPDSVKYISTDCFSGCEFLTELSFGLNSKLESIQTGIVRSSKIGKIFIGEFVNSIAPGSLSEAYNLTEIEVKSSNTKYSSEKGILYEGNGAVLVLCPGGIRSVIVKKSVVSIADSAFIKCINLINVSFEDDSKLRSIGPSTFYGCTALGSLDFPTKLERIESGAFEDCRSLVLISFPAGCEIVQVGARGFFGCVNLRSVRFSPSVQSIGASSFEGCSSLSRVEIAGNISEIGDSAFSRCAKLSHVSICINASRKEELNFADNAFVGCSNLSFTIGKRSEVFTRSATSIGTATFQRRSLPSTPEETDSGPFLSSST